MYGRQKIKALQELLFVSKKATQCFFFYFNRFDKKVNFFIFIFLYCLTFLKIVEIPKKSYCGVPYPRTIKLSNMFNCLLNQGYIKLNLGQKYIFQSNISFYCPLFCFLKELKTVNQLKFSLVLYDYISA